jgi:hypothetical protein
MQNEDPEIATIFGDPISASTRRKATQTLRKYARKHHYDENAYYPLFAEDNRVIGPFIGVKNVVSGAALEKLDPNKGVVIGTIRMGYGHYRIAMAIASAAHSMGYTPYWFDLLSFKTPGARLISNLDYWYSLGSRISQKSKLFNRLVWDPLMGKTYKRVEKNYPIMEVCRMFTDIYKDLPHDIPFVGTHPWPAMAAIHAGMKKVVNAIPDNCPLGFHLTEGALHAVQSPSTYIGFRTLKDMGSASATPHGVPSTDVVNVGHYVDHELVANAETDCAARLERMRLKKPRRILISVGGAGAQQPLFELLAERLLPLARDGEVALMFNFGDHKNVWNLLRTKIPGFEELAQTHFNWMDAVQFAKNAIDCDVLGIHAFLSDDPFAAVYTTNMLMRSSDILLTKPSELAYYPIPTLFLQHVGGHETWGAIRGAELGYGTIECESAQYMLQMLGLMILEDDIIAMQCENIVKLKQAGIFNGAYNVVELAVGSRGTLAANPPIPS